MHDTVRLLTRKAHVKVARDFILQDGSGCLLFELRLTSSCCIHASCHEPALESVLHLAIHQTTITASILWNIYAEAPWGNITFIASAAGHMHNEDKCASRRSGTKPLLWGHHMPATG